MHGKIFVYFIVTFLVLYAMDGLNINHLFKKNRVVQANLCYVLIAVSLIYLVTNFIMDVFSSIKMI